MVILFFIFCSIGKCFGCVLVNCTTIIVFCLQYSCSICLLRFKKENTRSWNLFKANKKKTPEWRHWRRSASLLLTLNWFYSFFWYSIIEFEQVNASWVLPPLFLIKSHSCSSSANAASPKCCFQNSELIYVIIYEPKPRTDICNSLRIHS